MTRNRAKKQYKYCKRILSKYGDNRILHKRADKLSMKRFSLPRRIRHRLHKSGKHLFETVTYTAEVLAIYSILNSQNNRGYVVSFMM